jgi:hypothetical protein
MKTILRNASGLQAALLATGPALSLGAVAPARAAASADFQGLRNGNATFTCSFDTRRPAWCPTPNRPPRPRPATGPWRFRSPIGPCARPTADRRRHGPL